MSVSNERTRETLNPTGQLFNGALSHFAMLCAMQPVMNKTTCMQTGKPFPANPWSSFAATNLSVLPPQATSFFVYGLFARYMAKNQDMTNKEKLTASVLAGAGGAPLASIFERAGVFRVVYKTKFFPAMQQIKAAEGYRGLFKGLSPTVAREIEYAVAVLYFRNLVSNWLQPVIPNKTVRDMSGSVVAGGAAGFVSAPFDLVNKTMKKDLVGSHSAVQTAWKIVTEEKVNDQTVKIFNPAKLWQGGGWRVLLVAGAGFFVGLGMDHFPKYLPRHMHVNKASQAKPA